MPRFVVSSGGDLDCSSANDLLRDCFVVVGPRHRMERFTLQVCNSKLYIPSFSDFHPPADFAAQCSPHGGRPDVPASIYVGARYNYTSNNMILNLQFVTLGLPILLASCAAYGPYHPNTSAEPLNSVR
jgi:hypothetical protein